MKLAEYLQNKGLSRSAFAKQIGVTPAMITAYCSDNPPWPGRAVMEAIVRATDGNVTAADFMTIEAAE